MISIRDDVKAFINMICGEGWSEQSDNDIQAAYGIACMQAYINGVRPAIDDLATYLQCDKEEIESSFQKLLQSGVFSKAFNARGDKFLNLNVFHLSKKKAVEQLRGIRCAWGYIGAIAAGIIIRNYSNMDVKAI